MLGRMISQRKHLKNIFSLLILYLLKIVFEYVQQMMEQELAAYSFNYPLVRY